jgi:two-component system, OmpR family, phosphate regulon sensor histidine kinase PhoR
LGKVSFKSKLIWSYVLLIIIPFVFVAVLLDKKLEELALQDIKSSLIKQAYLIENQIDPADVKKDNSAQLNSLAQTFGRRIGSRVTIIDKGGRVVADSEKSIAELPAMENHSDRLEVKTALSDNIGENIHYSRTLKINMLYTALPFKDNNSVIGAIRLALPLEQVRRILLTTRKTIVLSLFFALALAFVIGSLMARNIIIPLNRIIYVSRKFGQGEFNHRIHQGSGDEIGALAATLNTMAGEIETKIRQVEVQNQQLKTVFQSMVEGIIVVDRSTAIVTVNPPIENIFGVSGGKIKGSLFLEAIPNNDLAEVINKVLKSGGLVVRELSIVWPVNKIFQINASAIFQQKEVTGCLLVMHDITEIRRLETVRSDFVANVSHELKTPLTSIKGFVETLREGAFEDKENARHFLAIIQDHADRLNNLINDLLDLSSLESKAIQLENGVLGLKGMVDKVLAGFKVQLNRKSISVVNEIPATHSIQADQDKIEQVFTNIIDNAIKFNGEGGSIRISSEMSEGKIKIIVEDSGIGIPVKDLPRIFERFYRVDKARSRELGGTGLGLSIVKHIIELHKGTVGVESTEGLGSKFWFTIPCS